MKIIKNIFIPVSGYSAMAIKPYIFIQKKWLNKLDKFRDVSGDKAVDERYNKVINHEEIHFAQQEELGLIMFLVKYLWWWVRYGYKNIPFEREAYINAEDFKYLSKRKPFAYLKYKE